MDNSEPDRMKDEIERLRQAFDAATERCLELQRQLDRACGDFEEFISMTVHNLRQSLRDVTAFGQLLAEAHAASLDADAGECLAHIRQGAARMESLTTDVMDYWTTAGGDRASSRMDMKMDPEAVLGQTLLSLETQTIERSAILTHDALPVMMGDSALLAKVLRHLIRNALEYCDTASPRIHISCGRVDPNWVFSVADNGPGIDPAFQERIFVAFKRLHGKEYPGNGLGLAFCRKALARQGGKIWVQSKPGAGSTFYFTLPRPD
jgi:light-regulated signal transduction histidine kinase (bacteriophytochrome)